MSLSEWKKEAESRGWCIDALIEDLQKNWPDAANQSFDDDKDTQKKILCLALSGWSQQNAAGKLGLVITTFRPYCSAGLYQGLTQLYKSSSRSNYQKIVWKDIRSACEEMGYLD